MIVKKLQKEIQEEKDNAIQKRLKELSECRQLISENELAKGERMKKKQKEKDDDAAALIRYEKHLEERDKKRALEKEEREARMLARMNKMKETVIDKQDVKRKQEELRFIREVQDRENKEEHKEMSNQMKLRREQERLREFLANQVQEKKLSKKLEYEKNSMFIKQVLERDENDRSEEKGKIEKKKELETQCHKFLETQMKEKKSGKAFGMSAEEFLINKGLLKEISHIKKSMKNKDQNIFDKQALKPF